jgi:hypothetical protein
MKEEGRRKKEEGSLYMGIGTPTQNGRPRLGQGIKKNSEDNPALLQCQFARFDCSPFSRER